MNTLEHIELVARYRNMTRAELVACITDLVEMARENAHEGNDDGLKYLASFADSVAGFDALTVARDMCKPSADLAPGLYTCWIAGTAPHNTQRVIAATSSLNARQRYIAFSGHKETLTAPDVCARPLTSNNS